MRPSHRQFLLLLPLLLGHYASASGSPIHPGKPHSTQHTPKTRTRTKKTSTLLPSPRARVIHTLLAQLGKPYLWGGDSPLTGFDCSGLVYYTWHKNFNIKLPRTAHGMFTMPQAHPVPFHQLEPGDMVFFAMHGETVDHMGVYLGDGHFIEAPHTGQNVKIATLDGALYRQHYRGARRLLTSVS
ncbi:TPA: C40 family peptidase [Serratia marcescens]|uniref:Peptidoglycan endopeptidase n=1 Tax=Serratia marcescens TaxID=615 RepID=A0A9X8VM62_SERMA|nr:C40 family peptidase [Serratia marcescens]MBS3894928.1 C40 family peptidase [Serratia marcescens]HBC7422555.1 C40 family peptidase [Serratia marcescens]